MTMKSEDKTVDQEKFDMIKSMLKGGASVPDIARFMSYSTTTIYKINTADSLEDYRTTQAEYKSRCKERKTIAENASGNMASSYQQNRLIELQKETNDMLKLISNKLAFIVEELTGTGKQEARNEGNA